MTWLLLVEQMLNGVQFGVFLFLVSAGLTLVLGIMNVVNLAHGSLFMLGAYYATTIFAWTGSFLLALVVMVPLALISGIVIEVLVLRTMYDRDHMDQVLATFGLILFFNETVRLVWGAESQTMPVPGFLDGSVEILPEVPYPVFRLVVILVGLAIGGGLFFLITRTRIGMLIRAGASNRAMVSALGINIRLLYTLVFGLGAILAGIAGMMAGADPVGRTRHGRGHADPRLRGDRDRRHRLGPGRGHRLGANRHRRGGGALDPALRDGQLHGRGCGADRGARRRLDADLRADGRGPVLQTRRAVPGAGGVTRC